MKIENENAIINAEFAKGAEKKTLRSLRLCVKKDVRLYPSVPIIGTPDDKKLNI